MPEGSDSQIAATAANPSYDRAAQARQPENGPDRTSTNARSRVSAYMSKKSSRLREEDDMDTSDEESSCGADMVSSKPLSSSTKDAANDPPGTSRDVTVVVSETLLVDKGKSLSRKLAARRI